MESPPRALELIRGRPVGLSFIKFLGSTLFAQKIFEGVKCYNAISLSISILIFS